MGNHIKGGLPFKGEWDRRRGGLIVHLLRKYCLNLFYIFCEVLCEEVMEHLIRSRSPSLEKSLIWLFSMKSRHLGKCLLPCDGSDLIWKPKLCHSLWANHFPSLGLSILGYGTRGGEELQVAKKDPSHTDKDLTVPLEFLVYSCPALHRDHFKTSPLCLGLQIPSDSPQS